MISSNHIKTLASLRNKKYRATHGMFLAEGEKIVLDILAAPSRTFQIQSLLATREFLSSQPGETFRDVPRILEATETVLERISSLSTPNNAILVCSIPEYSPDFSAISNGLSLLLEDIRDPGNLGTIMRTADWFGIHHIFCTRESVDVYNPKVVQSTMGALCRVKVYYIDIPGMLAEIKNYPGYMLVGTVLDGQDIYAASLPMKGMIILGNESRGISQKLRSSLDLALTIPQGGVKGKGSESLNVSAAAAIVLSEFMRRHAGYSK